MSDDKLAADEARRASRHEAVRAEVESEVDAELAARAGGSTPAEARELEREAGELRSEAVVEVAETRREVERARAASRVSQVVDYVFYLVYALLGLRLLLALLAARPGAGFVRFVHAVTDPLYAPFRAIVPSPAAEGGYRLELPLLIAIVVYALLHAGVNGLLRLLAHRKTEI